MKVSSSRDKDGECIELPKTFMKRYLPVRNGSTPKASWIKSVKEMIFL